MTPPAVAEAKPRLTGEDTDVTVALIRTAFIIAFIAMRQVARGGPTVPLYVDLVLVVAALFNLLAFAAYLTGRSLHPARPLALALDLALVTAVVQSFPRGRDLWDLYYLVVITGAVWFRRGGAVLVALAAIATAIVAPAVLHGEAYDWQILQSSKAPLLLLVTLITAYLVRARDAEHSQVLQMSHEMRLARVLQSRMLPAQLPTVPGYDVGVIFRPARLVGGDFYDLRLLDRNHLLIVLADMAGKSVYGLVHLSLVHSYLQSAIREGLSPGDIAIAVNRGAYETLQPESYAALFVGILRLSDGLLTFANCGHVPPLRLRNNTDHNPDVLTTHGLVIGGLPDTVYEQREVTLAPDDLLVCFSDGVSEIRNRRREFFGEQQVAESAARLHGQEAQTIADNLLADTSNFAAHPGEDDVTLLVIRRLASGKTGKPAAGS